MVLKKSRPVVIVAESVYKKCASVFNASTGMDIIACRDAEDQITGMIRKTKAFSVVLGTEKYTGPLYEAISPGGVIARFGVGCDGINFGLAQGKGVYVTNTPGVLESTVAEYTVFLAGEVMRRIGNHNSEIKNGKWPLQLGNELHGKTWAIAGSGRIGKRVARILSFGFGTRVIAFDTNTSGQDQLKEEYGIETVSADFNEMAALADIVSIHIPLNEKTFHFIESTRLSVLKPEAILINTGRGPLVDEVALYDALKGGRLSGAGMDVFEREPYEPMDPAKDLRQLSNVVMTPHIASSTVECARRMGLRVIQNLQMALEGRFGEMDIVSG